MVNKIPQFVFDEGYDVNDWVEMHDRYNYREKINIKLNENKQKQLWLTNIKIRSTFQKIKRRMSENIKNEISISSRVYSISQIAKESNCDRNTLFHSCRGNWVKKKLNELIEYNSNYEGKDLKKKEVIGEIESLKRKLKLSRCEVAKQRIKVDKLEILNEIQKKTIYNKEQKLDSLKSENQQLFNELRNFKFTKT